MFEKELIGYFVENNLNSIEEKNYSAYFDFSWEGLVHKPLDNIHPAALYMFFYTWKEENIYLIHWITHLNFTNGQTGLMELTGSGKLHPPTQAHSWFQSRDEYMDVAHVGTLQNIKQHGD